MDLKMSTFTRRMLNREGLVRCLPLELQVAFALGAVSFGVGEYTHSSRLFKRERVMIVMPLEFWKIWAYISNPGARYRRVSESVLKDAIEMKNFLKEKLGTVEKNFEPVFRYNRSVDDEIVEYIQKNCNKKSISWQYIVLYE